MFIWGKEKYACIIFFLNTKICRWINFIVFWPSNLELRLPKSCFCFSKIEICYTYHKHSNTWLQSTISQSQKYSITSYSIQLFVSACQKLTTSKSSRPTTPNHYTPRGQQQPSYNPAGGPYAMASPGNATGSTTTGNGYGPGSGIISGGAPPSPGFQHSPHHASIPSSYHKVNMRKVQSLLKF